MKATKGKGLLLALLLWGSLLPGVWAAGGTANEKTVAGTAAEKKAAVPAGPQRIATVGHLETSQPGRSWDFWTEGPEGRNPGPLWDLGKETGPLQGSPERCDLFSAGGVQDPGRLCPGEETGRYPDAGFPG